MRHLFKYLLLCLLAALFLFLNGCEHETEPVVELTKISPGDYPDFTDDIDFKNLDTAIEQSLVYLNRIPDSRTFKFSEETYQKSDMIRSLKTFQIFIRSYPTDREITRFIRDNYILYTPRSRKKHEETLFTGYYEPFLSGSLEKSETYRYPVYSRPNDLIKINLGLFSDDLKGKRISGRLTDKNTVIPYMDREELEKTNHLKEKARPLAWVDSNVDLFFLEIQGSGRIYLDNGDSMGVHFYDKNGRAYRSIGRYMIDQEMIKKEDISMQSIKLYLEEHPEEVQKILNYNQSYVFFEREENGPIGSIGVKVTAGRSIATDRKIFPPAALTFITTEKPVLDENQKIESWIKFGRFVLNQDTGGAIKGPQRADLFCGSDAYAEIAAGHMQHQGHVYLMILK